MDEFERRIGPRDEIDFFVIQRHHHAQRPDQLAGCAVADRGLVEHRLIDIRLHQRQLDAGLVAQSLHVLGRALGRQHFERDVGRRRHPFREVAPDLDIGAALGRGDDLVVDRRQRLRR